MLLARVSINFLANSVLSDPANIDHFMLCVMLFSFEYFVLDLYLLILYVTMDCVSWKAFHAHGSVFTSFLILIQSLERAFILIRERFVWRASDVSFIFISAGFVFHLLSASIMLNSVVREFPCWDFRISEEPAFHPV